MHLFIDKTLRNLLLSQEATLVLSPGKCSYKGNVYVYEPFTIDEIEAKRLEIKDPEIGRLSFKVINPEFLLKFKE